VNLDAEARGQLAEQLIWTAIDFVGLVKRNGGAEAVGEFLDDLGDDERDALPVILAAMVDDDRTPDEMLSWVTWDEHGCPLKQPRSVTPRYRTKVDCGTAGAYRRHLELGEEPDPACEQAAAAERERSQDRQRRRREACKADAA